MAVVKSNPTVTTLTGSWLPVGAASLHEAVNKDTTPGAVTDSPRITDDDTNANPCQLTLDGIPAPASGVLVAAKFYYAYQKSAPLDNVRELYLTLKQGVTTLHSFTELDLPGTLQVAEIDLVVADIQFSSLFTLDLDTGGSTTGNGALHREVWLAWAQVELTFKDQATLTVVQSPVNIRGAEAVFCSNEGTTWGYNEKIFTPPQPTILGVDKFTAEYKISGVFSTKEVYAKKEGFFVICTKTAAYYLSYAQILVEGNVLEINIFDTILSYTVQAGDNDASIALALATLLKANGYASTEMPSGLLLDNIVGFFSTLDESFLLKVKAPLAKIHKLGKFRVIEGVQPSSNWSVTRSVNSEPC